MTNAMIANAKIPPIMAQTMIPIFAFGTDVEVKPVQLVGLKDLDFLVYTCKIHTSTYPQHKFCELGSQLHSSIWFASLEMKHNF
jgi:hypothetical protein